MNYFILAPRAAWVDPKTGTPTTEFYKFINNLFLAAGGGQFGINDVLVELAMNIDDGDTLSGAAIASAGVFQALNSGDADPPQSPDPQSVWLAQALADPVDAGAFGGKIITDVLAGTGIAVSTSGFKATVSIATTVNNVVLANISGGVAAPIPNTMTAIIDSTLGGVRGEIIYRGAANWSVLPLGTSGQSLVSNGTDILWGAAGLGAIPDSTFLANTSGGSASPVATTQTTFFDHAMGSSRGMILYRGASNWAALALGSTGQMLRSNGTDITWASLIGYAGDQSYQTSNWAAGNTVSSQCSFYVSATTQQTNQREILAGAFLISDKGSGASSPQRDKVALSGQVECRDGSGDTWGIYPVNVINAGAMASTGFTAFGIEIDLNNNAVDLSSPTTIGGKVAQAYGLALTGSSAYLATAAIWVTGVGAQWDKGIWFTGSATIGSYTFRDETNSPTSIQILGTHTYGIDLSNGVFTHAIKGPGNGSINFEVDSSGHALAPGYGGTQGSGGTSYGNLFSVWWTGAAAQLWIDTTNVGDISLVSDYRLKSDVIALKDGMDTIRLLKPVKHRWRDEGIFRDDGQEHRSFLAHELQAVIPSAVTGEKDGQEYQTIRPREVLPDMVRALQEIDNRLGAIELATRVAALQERRIQ